ncbi:MAG: leucine-rich repeat protein [Faecousia sp.]
MKKRITATILAITMLFALLPATLFVASAETLTGTCGDGLTWTLDTDTSVLTIFGFGEMKDYNYSYNGSTGHWETSVPWMDYISSLKSVIIENGVTSIGQSAFSGCTGLTSIEIPDSVTRIGEQAFEYCTGLTSITIPNSVTSIGSCAFFGCKSLTSIEIPGSVASIGDNAFGSYGALSSISVAEDNASYCSVDGVLYNKDKTALIRFPDGKSGIFTIPDGVEIICTDSFKNCKGLIAVTIPVSTQIIQSYAFSYSENLLSVFIPNSVSDIGYGVFEGCFKLKDVFYSGTEEEWNAISIDDTNYELTNATRHYESVASSEAPVFSVSCGADLTGTLDFETGVLTISGTGAMTDWWGGSSCAPWNMVHSSIKSVVIENGVTSIGRYAFLDCSNLASIVIPASVESIGYNAFKNCTSLADISVDADNQQYLVVDDILYDKNQTSLIRCSVQKADSVAISDSVTSINNDAFNGCSGITEVSIPRGVTSIGEDAFRGCVALKDVNYGGGKEGWNKISISPIGNECLTQAAMHFTSVFSGTCGEGVEWTINTVEGLLEITGNGAMDDWPMFFSSTPWNAYADTIKEVRIDDGITHIGENAFYRFSNLKSVFIPSTVTGIGSRAFSQCTSLESLFIPHGVTSIGESAFSACTSLVSLSVPDSVTTIGRSAFSECENLEKVSLSSSMDTIEDSLFRGCARLTSFTIPQGIVGIANTAFEGCTELAYFNVSEGNRYFTSIEGVLYSADNTVLILCPQGKSGALKVSDATIYINNGACRGCNQLTSVSLPNSVTIIDDYAFSNCSSLTEINIPDGVTSICFETFAGDNSLNSITIPSSVTCIESGAFYNCTSLENINIPDSVTSIGGGAFENTKFYLDESNWSEDGLYIGSHLIEARCGDTEVYTIREGTKNIANGAFSGSTITSIVVPASVTSIGKTAFTYCRELQSIVVDEQNTVYSSSDGVLFSKDKSVLVAYPVGKTGAYTVPNGVTTIGERAFSSAYHLTSVTLPDTVTAIENYAFYWCSDLGSITLPDSIKRIGQDAFTFCEYYEKDSNWAGEVLYIGNHLIEARSGYGYGGGLSLRERSSGGNELSIPDELAEKRKSFATREMQPISGAYEIRPGTKTIADYAFSSCVKLEGITIPDSVEHIGNGAFSQCSSLTSIDIPVGVKTIGESAFWGCDQLKTIYIPATVTSLGDYSFECCTALKEIQVDPNNTNYLSIDNVLYNAEKTVLLCCAAEKEGALIIPDGVNTIMNSAFWGCGKLTSVTIPTSVTSIGNIAFHHCLELADVSFLGTKEEWNKISIGFANESLASATIHFTEHTHSYIDAVTAPTCTESGFTTHTCKCGDSYVDTYVDALGHNYVNGVCTRCGAKDPDYKPTTPVIEFNDIPANAWYIDAVAFAVENGLMNGVGDNKFDPEGSMTRAMLVTVLWRYEGSPKKGTNTFADVPNGRWYTDAIAWAAAEGVVGGVGNGKFEPDGNVTREQMATILFRYANKKGFDTSKRGDLSGFPDASRVSFYAKDALAWAVAEKIINGSDGYLLPQGDATRAQVSAILMRYIKNIADAK